MHWIPEHSFQKATGLETPEHISSTLAQFVRPFEDQTLVQLLALLLFFRGVPVQYWTLIVVYYFNV